MPDSRSATACRGSTGPAYQGFPKSRNVGLEVGLDSPTARGSALKPSYEPVVMARKPLAGTLARTVLEYGTGALNIDDTRISSGQRPILGGWEDEPSLCDACADRAGENGTSTAPTSRASTAPSDVEPTTNGRAETLRSGTSKTDIGCSAGTSEAAQSADPIVPFSSSIDGSGKTPTGQSRPDTSSTTSTKFEPTIGSRTCSSCGSVITSAITTRENPSGRWPSNVVLSHHEDCEQVGTRRVKAQKPREATPHQGNSWQETGGINAPGRTFFDSEANRHADADGMEEIQAWRCVESCPVRLLDEQSGAVRSSGHINRSDAQHDNGSHGEDVAVPNAGARSFAEPGVNTYSDSGGASRFFLCTKGAGGSLDPSGSLGSAADQLPSRPPHDPSSSPQDEPYPQQESSRLSRSDNSHSCEDSLRETSDEARFRYTAKASSAERNAGLEGFEEREVWRTTGEGLGLRREPGSLSSTDEPTQRKPARNGHPTVKPIALMRWLVRLVTPPGGTVLDPFTGSGTTGIAAALEGFDFVGIEREEEYVRIAEARIKWWGEHPEGVEITKSLEADRKRRAVADTGQLGFLD
jgi:hypothetical protein